MQHVNVAWHRAPGPHKTCLPPPRVLAPELYYTHLPPKQGSLRPPLQPERRPKHPDAPSSQVPTIARAPSLSPFPQQRPSECPPRDNVSPGSQVNLPTRPWRRPCRDNGSVQLHPRRADGSPIRLSNLAARSYSCGKDHKVRRKLNGHNLIE